jgi:hypothetical protein
MENTQEKRSSVSEQSGWGAKLFIGTLIMLAVFFWWLLIYSGGAVVHHG